MTDQRMDDRLRAAGERWRTENIEVIAAGSTTPEIVVQLAPRRSRHRWITAASAAMVTAALVAGGFYFLRHDGSGNGAPIAEAASQLTGRTWQIPSTGGTLTIQANGTFSANDGCNSGGGKAAVSGDSIVFSDAAFTAMGCVTRGTPSPDFERVDQFFAGRVTWSVTGADLTLAKPGVGTLALSSTPAPTATDLTAHAWQLADTETTNGNSGSGQSAVGRLTLSFGTATFLLADACTTTTGTVQINSGTLTISHVVAAIRPNVRCAFVKSIEDERKFVQAVLADGATKWVIGQGVLRLSRGTHAATFDTVAGSGLTVHAWQLTGTQTTKGNSGSGSSAVSESDLSFTTDATFTVKHHCYSLTGDYTVAGDAITFAKVHVSDAVPCASNAESRDGQQENGLVDALFATGSTQWAIKGGTLTLTTGPHAASFAAPAAGGVSALTGSHWKLTAIEHGTGPDGIASSPSAQTEFDFSPNTVAFGRTSIPVKVGQQDIDVIGAAVDDPSAGQPTGLSGPDLASVRQILVGAMTYTIDGATLTITKAGVGALVFTKMS